MNLVSSKVLGAAAVLAAPVLYDGFVTGAVAMETAVQRYVVVAVIAWLGLSMLEALIGPPPQPGQEQEQEQATDAGRTGQPPPP